ncbi:MAG: TOBE domain-containing protein, partial [Dehalococcoidia bacterium]
STHDMFQGQRLADRIGVIISGEMLQTSDPRKIFSRPQSRSLAEFVGMENLLSGVIASNEDGIVTIDTDGIPLEAISNLDPGSEVYACIRPEEVTLAPAKDLTSARNTFPGEVSHIVLFGPLARVEIDCGFPLVALITKKSAEEMGLQTGSCTYAYFKATGVHIIER